MLCNKNISLQQLLDIHANTSTHINGIIAMDTAGLGISKHSCYSLYIATRLGLCSSRYASNLIAFAKYCEKLKYNFPDRYHNKKIRNLRVATIVDAHHGV